MLYPSSGDNQYYETFLALSADNQTDNYDTECSIHNLFQSPVGTILDEEIY